MPPPEPDKLGSAGGDGADIEPAAVEEEVVTGKASLATANPTFVTPAFTNPTFTIMEDAQAGQADESLLSKISVFHQRRQKDKTRMFRNVMLQALVLIILGLLGSAIARILAGMWGWTHLAPAALIVISLSINAWAFVAFASCLSDELDINAMTRSRPRIVTAAFAALLANAVYRTMTGFYMNAVEVPIAIGGAVYAWDRIRPTWWPLVTTWLAAWFIYFFVTGGVRRLPFYERDDTTTLPAVITCIGCFYILVGAGIFAAWLWAHRFPERCSPTMLFYGLCVLWSAVQGLQDVLHGLAWMALPEEGSADVFSAAVLVCRGVGMLLPPLVIVLLGRQRLFNTLARIFDGNEARLQRDGAFVAELLDTVPICAGQAWWVHREKAKEQFRRFDPRRNWRRGVVAEVGDGSSEFVVQLDASEALHAWKHHASSQVADQSVRVQLAASAGRTRDEILRQAHADLRCVDFENLSAELMTTQDSRGKPELQAEWYGLSRPVRPGERIDYFMSHSWHDDPAVKWAMIKKVAERFRTRVGRYPTFWLDKVCIDQTAVSDGLKVLPVNVMACAKVLLLCGATYPKRLWCIWELFTLYAFTSEAAAHQRVECVFLGNSDQGKNIHNQMRKFHVRHAHCYDPNEEARLRRVISAVGADSFNQRICQMAELLQFDQETSSRRLTGLARLVGGKQGSRGPEAVSP